MLKKVLFSIMLVSLMVLPIGLDHSNNRGQASSLVLLGIYPNDSIGTHNYEITLLESYLGENKVSIAGGFLDFEESPDWWITSELNAAWDNGYWPLMNIGAGNVPDSSCTDDVCTAERIANGELDTAITNWAQIFKAWTDNGTKKAYLAPLQEMNGNWVDYFGDPANYILAYTHIQDIFMNDVGVDPASVEWVFAPNGWSASGDPGFEDYYPGDAAIDVVGFSSFNWGTCFTGTTWEGYDDIYLPYLNRMATMAPTKPIFILEMASHTEGGDRADWFDVALTAVGDYSGVGAVLYFNRAEDPHNPNLLSKCNEGTTSNPLIDYSLDHNGGEGKLVFKTEITHSRYGYSVPTSPEMDVKGNGQSIANNDSTPSGVDDTDFGSVNVASGSETNIFTIENTGTANLFLTGSPKVEITGAHAGDFNVTVTPSSWMVALGGGTRTFEVTFDPSAAGVRTATVSIDNDDNDEDPYNFSIQGTGILTTNDTIGLYDPDASYWYLKPENVEGWDDYRFKFSKAWMNRVGISGDWNGDGVDTIGLYDPSDATWTLSNTNSSSTTGLIRFKFGRVGDNWIPISGDWDGDGIDNVGLFDPDGSYWYLKPTFVSGWDDLRFKFGNNYAGRLPVTGDWNGNGTDTVGLYDPAVAKWMLKNTNSAVLETLIRFKFGRVGDNWIPVAGDWNDDGTSTVGLFDPDASYWYLKPTFVSGWDDYRFKYGQRYSNWYPNTGYWGVLP